MNVFLSPSEETSKIAAFEINSTRSDHFKAKHLEKKLQ